MADILPVTVDLPRDLLLALGRAAGQARCHPAELLVVALTVALKGGAPLAGPGLAQAVLLASDWLDLQKRLRSLGCVLRPGTGDGLILCRWPDNHPICPADRAGISRAALCLRYGRDFPASAPPVLPRRGADAA